MNYLLRIGDEEHAVETENVTDGSFKAAMDGKTMDVAWVRISDNHLRIARGGSCVNAYITGSGDSRTIFINGVSYLVQDTAAAQNVRKKQSLKNAPQAVTPPMPSLVVRILVREGERVEKGQAVAVVSAMKMETTLRSPYDGKVSAVNVAEGDKVMPGDILVDIEKHESTERLSN